MRNYQKSCLPLIYFLSGESHESIKLKIQEIARRLWETAGNPKDKDLDFWLKAESVFLSQIREKQD